MTHDYTPDLSVPAELAAQLRAAAEAQHRAPLEVLHDAVEQYLTGQRPAAVPRRSPAEAAARMRCARASNARLDDAALRDLLTHRRA